MKISPFKKWQRLGSVAIWMVLGGVASSFAVASDAKGKESKNSGTPRAAPTPAPTPAATPVKITHDEARVLLAEFSKAQLLEMKALEHRHRFELKELKASQDSRQREFNKKEQAARRLFFQEHTKGPERRTYVQEFFQRRDIFHKMLTEEHAQRVQEHAARHAAIEHDQSKNLKEFRRIIEKGERPPSELWPKPGV